MKLVFATNNKNKIKEIKSALGDKFKILSLQDINCYEELPETQNTLVGNALQKARYVAQHYNVNCFADDTGLLIDALNGEPGVYSARYAGEEKSAQKNIEKVLNKLQGEVNRNAHFETAITLIIGQKEYTFIGKAAGTITTSLVGEGGFGYDPIFLPNGYTKTFAELSLAEKNAISHRGKAFREMCDFLYHL